MRLYVDKAGDVAEVVGRTASPEFAAKPVVFYRRYRVVLIGGRPEARPGEAAPMDEALFHREFSPAPAF